MKEWPLVQLRRITTLVYGDSLAADDRTDGSVPVYGSNGRIGEHGVPNTSGPAVIIGRKGSFGKIQYSTVPTFAIDTTFYVDETHTSANLRWLFYALTTLNLDTLSEDVGVPGLSRDSAYAQRLPLPSPGEQEGIANYLDRETTRIDDLIAKKQQQIVLLTERRQALITATVNGELDIPGLAT
jgi:type I restriction enzyme S subunit